MGARGGELVTTNESPVVSEPFLDDIVVKNGQSNGCFSDPPWTDESGWSELFRETDDLLDQLVASEAGPGRRGR